MNDNLALSVVVPFFNEEESIEPMHKAIVDAVEPLGVPFEMIFVDDGSHDGTLAIGEALTRADDRVRMISFRRNYGQTPAMAAGIDHACGRVIVTMDGDLQNDPRDIGAFLQKIGEGYDIVVGWRHKRQDKLITRKIPSKIANWLIGKVTGVPIKDNGCSLKAYRANVIQQVPLYAEMHRFIPAMASVAGPRIAEIKVRHHARQFGTSKYGLSRTFKVLLDLLTIKTLAGFFSRPGLWFSVLSLPFILIGLLLLGGAVVQWLRPSGTLPIPVAGTALLSLSLSAFLIFGGALGELIFGTGDTKIEDFAKLTSNEISAKDPAEARDSFS